MVGRKWRKSYEILAISKINGFYDLFQKILVRSRDFMLKWIKIVEYIKNNVKKLREVT